MNQSRRQAVLDQAADEAELEAAQAAQDAEEEAADIDPEDAEAVAEAAAKTKAAKAAAPVDPRVEKAKKKDIACKRYEQMLDMATQTANKNKTRFPLKLFGFVINTTLIGTWIGFASGTLGKQAQSMAPRLAMKGCNFIEHSSAFTLLAAEAAKHSSLGKNVPKASMPKMFHDAVCIPLHRYLKKKKELAAQQKLMQAAQRHLLEDEVSPRQPHVPSLAPVVESWWKMHRGDANAKLAIAMMHIDELSRESHRLLEVIPAAAANAHAAAGADAALYMLESHLSLPGRKALGSTSVEL